MRITKPKHYAHSPEISILFFDIMWDFPALNYNRNSTQYIAPNPRADICRKSHKGTSTEVKRSGTITKIPSQFPSKATTFTLPNPSVKDS